MEECEKKEKKDETGYIKPTLTEIGDASKLTRATTGPDSDGIWGQMASPVS